MAGRGFVLIVLAANAIEKVPLHANYIHGCPSKTSKSSKSMQENRFSCHFGPAQASSLDAYESSVMTCPPLHHALTSSVRLQGFLLRPQVVHTLTRLTLFCLCLQYNANGQIVYCTACSVRSACSVQVVVFAAVNRRHQFHFDRHRRPYLHSFVPNGL